MYLKNDNQTTKDSRHSIEQKMMSLTPSVSYSRTTLILLLFLLQTYREFLMYILFNYSSSESIQGDRSETADHKVVLNEKLSSDFSGIPHYRRRIKTYQVRLYEINNHILLPFVFTTESFTYDIEIIKLTQNDNLYIK